MEALKAAVFKKFFIDGIKAASNGSPSFNEPLFPFG